MENTERAERDIEDTGSRRVDVWLLDPSTVDDRTLAACEPLLDRDERERHSRFLALEARRTYLVSRALLRTVLTRYVEVDPRRWGFAANRYGKPRIAEPRIGRDLRFNLSHTSGLVALAVTEGADIGVDVERIGRIVEVDELVGTVLAPDEIIALESAAEGDRIALFLTFWTLKEAYVKARGMGLSLDLLGIAFDVSRPEPIVRFRDRRREEPSRWSFFRGAPSPDHCLAIAVAAPAIELRFAWTTPLGDAAEREPGFLSGA